MSTITTSWLLILCAILVVYLWRRYTAYRAAVDSVPGPAVQSILFGNLNYYVKPSGMGREEYLKKFYQILRDLYTQFRHHGVFRMWMGPGKVLYVLTDVESVECLLTSQVHINKGSEYQFMAPWLGNGLLLLDSAAWRQRRRLLKPAFHYRALHNFLPIFSKHTSKLIGKLEVQLGAHTECVITDIRHLFEDCMLDIIKETSLGVDGTTDTQANAKYRKCLKSAIIFSVNRVKNPLHWVEWAYRWTRSGRKFWEYLKYMEDYAEEIITKRIKYLRHLNDPSFTPTKIIDILLQNYLKRDPQIPESTSLDQHTIRNEISTFIFGGHDTTATSSIYSVLLIGHHPAVQEKIWKELEAVLGDDPNRMFGLDDLRQLRYLEACIKETLRLYPPGQVVGRRIDEPLRLPNGHTLLAGSNCYIPIVHIQRDDRYFEQPEQFLPDRWTAEGAGSLSAKNPYAFLPFSAGVRTCIGQKYGLLELKYVLAEVLRRFEIQSVTKPEDILVGITPLLTPMSRIEVMLKRRFTE